MLKFINNLKLILNLIEETIILSTPNKGIFFKQRRKFWRNRGVVLSDSCTIARNVVIVGNVSIGSGSSISNNCFLNGSKEGITLGDKVMIAPNCVIVAFDHDYSDLEIPMIDQGYIDAKIVIEDNVWIGANCTITKGVVIGTGSIVGANSVVTKDVLPYTIVGGTPAKTLGVRKK